MNLIYIVLDSLRADYLGCYGNSWVKTPFIDKLAGESVLFENAYVEGFATIPARYVFFTGKYAIPYHGWEPLKDNDVTIAQILGRKGHFAVPTLGKENYINALVADTYHLFKMNFHRGFHAFRWIRGQEFDNYVTDPRVGVEEIKKHLSPTWEEQESRWTRPRDWLHQYYRNVRDRRYEEDYFAARTVREAIHWLEENSCQKKFFLWLDIFDPHEPWDPPEHFYEMYRDPSYDGPIPIWAGFTSPFPEDYTEQEMSAIRAAYAGEVSFVDRWIGQLLEKMDDLGLKDDTLLVLTSDHGTAQGEHDFIGKTSCGYREVNRIPLVMRVPEEHMARRVSSLVWAPDILPTILEILGVSVEAPFHGKSFWPIVQREEEKSREFVVCGEGGSLQKHGQRTSLTRFETNLPSELGRRMAAIRARDLYLTDGEWSFIFAPSVGNELYDLREDPGETRNLVLDCPEKAKDFEQMIELYRKEVNVPI